MIFSGQLKNDPNTRCLFLAPVEITGLRYHKPVMLRQVDAFKVYVPPKYLLNGRSPNKYTPKQIAITPTEFADSAMLKGA